MITATIPDTGSISTYDIVCRRGDTFSAAFTFTDKVYTEEYELKCEVRDMYKRRHVLTFTPILEAPNIIHLDKGATQMVVRAGTYQYDLAIVSPEGTDIDVVQGTFIVEEDVTANIPVVLVDYNNNIIITDDAITP